MLYGIYAYFQINGKLGPLVPFIIFVSIFALVGGLGGLLNKSWGWKVSVISVGIVTALQVVGGNITATIIGAIVGAALVFIK